MMAAKKKTSSSSEAPDRLRVLLAQIPKEVFRQAVSKSGLPYSESNELNRLVDEFRYDSTA